MRGNAGKMWSRITPNKVIFYAVSDYWKQGERIDDTHIEIAELNEHYSDNKVLLILI